MSIQENLQNIKATLPQECKLVAVSKTKTNSDILEAYQAGQRLFGENKVQDLVAKYEALPKDIEWHFIGHLQSNKIKYIVPFVSLIHGVDSLKLLQRINTACKKINSVQDILLQVHIAQEESKFGFSYQEISELLASDYQALYPFVQIKGLMGMASNTSDTELVQKEFSKLHKFYSNYQKLGFEVLSMGMSNDYPLAVAAGSNMVRVGSSIFGARNYH